MTEAGFNEAHLRLHAFNRVLSTVIRTGIVISLVLFAGGLILYSVQGDTAAGKLVDVLSLPAEMTVLNPAAFITLGLILLLMMPPVILLATFIHFIKERQKKPVIVCILLAALLVTSIVVILTVH